MDIIKHLLTEKDNQTFDLARVLWAVGVVTFLFLAGYALIGKGQTWDPQAFGVGLCAVLGAGGAVVVAKAKTEAP